MQQKLKLWSDLPFYGNEDTCLNLFTFYQIRVLLIVLKFWLAVMSRLTFELVNGHFNLLGDDDLK